MKVVILAGGMGTRLMENTERKPKPLMKIGGKPILWHIMKIYSHYGFNEFIICLGYKGNEIKKYFYEYFYQNSDFTINTGNNKIEIHNKPKENFKITLVDTGENTMTGGRILRIKDFIDDTFMLTYGDGLADIDINELLKYHRKHKKTATVTSILLEGQFGYLAEKDGIVTNFREKGKSNDNWINGGFFVCEHSIFNYLDDDATVFEKDPLEKLVEEKELVTYKHHGFWKCMDMLKDLQMLNKMWESKPLWKIWKD